GTRVPSRRRSVLLTTSSMARTTLRGSSRRSPTAAARAGINAQPRLARAHDRLGARGRADLPEDVRDVIAHGLLADAEPVGDLTVVEAARDEGEHFGLAVGELRKGGGQAPGTAGIVAGGEERLDLGQKLIKAGLVLEQQVIPTLERNEAGVRDQRGEAPSFLERDTRLLTRVEDERRHVHLGCDVADIQIPERPH